MKIKRIAVSPFETNCYIIQFERYCIVVDPGGDAEKIKRELSLPIQGILLTHGHYDHIGALNAFEGIDVYISQYDEEYLHNSNLNLSEFIGQPFVYNGSVNLLAGDRGAIQLPNTEIKFIRYPGHTPGSVCYFINDTIFSGDFIFMNSIGRTDLPGGDDYEMASSLDRFKHDIKGNYRILPGHGPETFLQEEIKFNPFLR